MTGIRLKVRSEVCERKRLRRKNMSPTRLAILRGSGHFKKHKNNLSLEQLERRRERDRIHKRVKRESMTQVERSTYRERDRVRQQLRRGNMTETKRDAERERDRIRKRLKRSAQAGVFSFGTKGSDLWRMEFSSWSYDNIDNPWPLPSYTNVSDLMEAAFCVVNMNHDLVNDDGIKSGSSKVKFADPLSVSSVKRKEEIISNFHEYETTECIPLNNIGVKVFNISSTNTENSAEHDDGCEIDLITPEVIITTDGET